MKLEAENVFIKNGIIHATTPDGREIAAGYLTARIHVHSSEIPENRSYEADNRLGSRKRIIPQSLRVENGFLYVKGPIWDEALGYIGYGKKHGLWYSDNISIGPIVKLTERNLTIWEL